jgi:hypothetical protein
VSQPPYGSNWPPEQGGEQPDPDATQRRPDPGPTEQLPDWGATQQQPEWGPTQQLPEWGPTQQLPDWGSGQQPPGYGEPQYPNPTRPLPPYQPPPGQWGGPPQGLPGPPYQPPYPPGPPGPPGPPWGQPPRRRNTTLIVVLAIIGVLVVGGAVAGIIVATGGKKKHDTQQTTHPSGQTNFPPPTGGGTSAPDFPTNGSTGFPSSGIPTATGGGGGGGDSVKVVIAQNAETVLHGLGNDQPSAFCPLIDPTDLKRLLKEKHLGRCSDIKLTDSTNKAEYQTYSVTAPDEITINGNNAEIPSDAGSPSDIGTVDMRKDTDGNWKFRFYP